MYKRLDEVFVEIGELEDFEIPAGYDHLTSLRDFHREHGTDFCCYSGIITDFHFSAISTVQLCPGQKFKIKIFRHQDEDERSSTSEDRFKFLEEKGATFLGANGLIFLFKHGRMKLARGFVYSSLDLHYALPMAEDRRSKAVPCISMDSEGRFTFDYSKFENPHGDRNLIVGFFEVK